MVKVGVAGGLAVARLLAEGVDFAQPPSEGWVGLEEFGGEECETLLDALAAKCCDTHAIDTIVDPCQRLAATKGFEELSSALDEHFAIENSLTSGLNDDYGSWKFHGDLPGSKENRFWEDIGSADIKARRGVGSTG